MSSDELELCEVHGFEFEVIEISKSVGLLIGRVDLAVRVFQWSR